MARTFDDKPATREQVPLLVGLGGASNSGKTYSALRMATGMREETGGDIFVIDTESRRALHYADKFDFRHVDFREPFSPDDYLAAIKHCKDRGASIIVVDSASHEHEGPGGVLEWHERELDRMAGNDFKKRDRMTFAAWAKPKAARRRLINTVVQLGVNAIFCFRAKEKLKIRRGQEPEYLGWMPISGDEWVFEMTLHCLLYPGSGGVPTWSPEHPGERVMTKLPKQFEDYLLGRRGPIDEEVGRHLAEWAKGGTAPKPKQAEPPPDPASWLDEPLGYGKKVISGKPAKEHTWRWFSEGGPGGGRHSYLKAVIDKIDAEEDPHSTLVAFKEKALEVCGIIEDVPDEAA